MAGLILPEDLVMPLQRMQGKLLKLLKTRLQKHVESSIPFMTSTIYILGAHPVAREPHVALILKFVAPEIF